MFVHSGAGLHGHEYSHRQRHPNQSAIQRPSPLLRHSLVHPCATPQALHLDTLSNPSSTASASFDSSTGLSISTSRSSFSNSPRPSSVRPSRPLSELVPRTEQLVRFEHHRPEYEPVRSSTPAVPQQRHGRSLSVSFSSVVSTCPPAATPDQAPATCPSSTPQPYPLVEHREETRGKPEATSEDEGLSASEVSDASQGNGVVLQPKKKRQARRSTAFFIAHPPPRQNNRPCLIQVRPRLMMQLQQISADRRPRPSLDVFPSSILASTGISNRLINRFPRMFGSCRELGHHDVLLVKSENYESGSHEDSDDEREERLGKRELIAILSPLIKEGRAEIVLADGSVWLASPLPNGAFEFVHTEPETGLLKTARWVKRSVTRASKTPSSPCEVSGASPATGSSTNEYRLTFSIINPLSRRHPIMASLTPTCLEILESYTTVSSSAGRYPPTTNSKSFIHGSMEDDGSGISMPVRTSQVVDEAMKTLISVTSIWVALRQGWSPYYKYPIRPSAVNRPEAAPPPGIPGPNASSTPCIRGLSPSIGAESQPGCSSPNPSATSAAVPLRNCFGYKAARESSSERVSPFGIPRRATSTGAAFIQRRTRQQPDGVTDASDTERPAGRTSRRRRILSGEWNIPRRRAQSPLRQTHDGGVELDHNDPALTGHLSLDARVLRDQIQGRPNSVEQSLSASNGLTKQREHRSLPAPPRDGAATSASSRSERNSMIARDNADSVILHSPTATENVKDSYFDQLEHDEEEGGVSIAPGGASLYVEFEDKKRGKWKIITGWIRKFGTR